MKFNRTKNASTTFVYGAISQIVSIICPFIIRTIIIYKLGADYVGLTSLFSSILTLLSVSELGIASAISFSLYKPIAEDNKKAVSALIGLMKKLYLAIGTFITVLGLGLMPFIDRLINGNAPADINIYVLYLIYLLNTVSSYFGFAYKGVLFEAYQKGDINHKITICVEMIKNVSQIIILLAFANYYYYAIVLPISTIAINIITEFKSRKVFSDIIPQGSVDKETKNTIKSKVLYLSLHSIASKLTTSVDNIVISGALGLAAIAIFGNYQYIYGAIFTFISISYRAFKPVVANSYYVDSEEKNYMLFKSLKLASFWMCTWCSACLLSLLQPFITVWIGSNYLLTISTVIIIIAYFFSNASRQFYTSIYVEMLGLWNKTLPRQVLAAVVNLFLDILLVKSYGIAGIVFASFFTNMFIAFPLDVYVTYKYVLKRNIKEGIVSMVMELFLACFICTLTFICCNIIHLIGIPGLFIKGIICLTIPNFVLFILCFRSNEFKYLMQHVKMLKP